MLTSYIGVFESELYEKVNNIAAHTYEEWLKEQYRIHYLTEMLYHQISIKKFMGVEDPEIVKLVGSKILSLSRAERKHILLNWIVLMRLSML